MSIGAAITNALTGLNANGLSARTVSSNVSNALTPGYGVRETTLSSSRFGGVEVNGIQRQTDPRLVGDRRIAEADLEVSKLRSTVLSRVGNAIGEAGEAGSLSERVAALGGALIEAAATPDNDVRLETAVKRVEELASGLRNASQAVQNERSSADAAISTTVDRLNTALSQVADLNEKIKKNSLSGKDISSYLDQRQNAIDEVANIVPVREIPRKGGAVMLVSQNGQVLLDKDPAEVTFRKAPIVTSGMEVGDPLSKLSVGSREIGDMTASNGKMAGGRLAELFSLRDQELPEIQKQLDGFAEDLVDRFAEKDGATDKTVDGRKVSLFMDPGGNGSDSTGIAGRIEIFSSPDGEQDLSKKPRLLRDGLLSESSGDKGNSTRLTALANALDLKISSGENDRARDAGSRADAVQSAVGSRIYEAERGEARNRAAFEASREAELSQGVDTDAELQKLLLIEQAYGANARVLQVANSLIQRIMEI